MDAARDSRRRFLQSAAGLAVAGELAVSAQAAAPLPTVRFGNAEITRLIIGSNPFYGYAHFNHILSRTMREWYTPERKLEVLNACERAGIGTWQLHYNDESVEDFRRYREQGGKMSLLLLADFALMRDPGMLPAVARDLKPLGIAHHGNRTDERFAVGYKDLVRDYLKAIRDTGVMVGLSSHNPEVIEEVESEGWDIDYYQTCLYRITRGAAQAREQYGEAPIGEIYMEKDPERMTEVIRQTSKPCLAFKLFGAGRTVRSSDEVERCLRFAYDNIKPTDACIVGMFPKFSDEVAENTGLVRKILTS